MKITKIFTAAIAAIFLGIFCAHNLSALPLCSHYVTDCDGHDCRLTTFELENPDGSTETIFVCSECRPLRGAMATSSTSLGGPRSALYGGSQCALLFETDMASGQACTCSDPTGKGCDGGLPNFQCKKENPEN